MRFRENYGCDFTGLFDATGLFGLIGQSLVVIGEASSGGRSRNSFGGKGLRGFYKSEDHHIKRCLWAGVVQTLNFPH
jgi:hypothetical protein